MDVDEIQTHGCKFPRIGGNNRMDGRRMGQNGEDDEEDGEVRREALNGSGSSTGHNIGVIGSFCGWPSSRIVRVSRASGGKDRHSKVLTSRGLRDRRIRLSVLTAIQFYDLQDRLGLDQPSKAVEWLLKAAATSIDDLPPIKASLPETPKQLSDERRSSAGTEHGFDSNELEIDGDPSYQHHQQQQQQQQLSKSACSSTSETSKGSGLSLSRSESRLKARERARGRAAEKEKEKESDSRVANVNPISQNSFTELLSSGINNTSSPSGSNQGGGNGEANFFHKNRHWSSGPTEECFTSGLFGSSRHNNNHHNNNNMDNNRHSSSRFSSGQIHLGGALPIISPFNVTGEQHPPELQHFSLVPDHLIPVAPGTGNGSDYNLNFTISNLAGFSRGTLQSNSPSLSTLPHLQRFLPLEGSNTPFFMSSAGQMAAPVENHHQFPASLDDRLHLYYRDPEQKGKGKN